MIDIKKNLIEKLSLNHSGSFEKIALDATYSQYEQKVEFWNSFTPCQRRWCHYRQRKCLTLIGPYASLAN